MVFGQYLNNTYIQWIAGGVVTVVFSVLFGTGVVFAADPVADFRVTDNRDGSITFDASRSTDSDGSIVNYRWDFGDTSGEVGEGAQVTHCYEEQGTYNVILSVTDNAGAGDDMTAPVEIMSEPTCDPDAGAGVLRNPLGDISTIPEFLAALLDQIVKIAIPIIIIFIIYAGFLFITAQGQPEKLAKAKKTLLWVIIGAAVIIGADLLANVIVGTIKDLGS